MSAAKHTPGPWHVWQPTRRSLPHIRSESGLYVMDAPPRREGVHGQVRQDADARLIAAAPELLGALVWREQFEPRSGEGDNERFERIADTFFRETGYLRPGKDCRIQPIEVRQRAWDEWMETGRVRVRAAIAAATGGAS